MRKWRWLLAGLGATVVACSGGEEDAIVGKWKRSDNEQVMEFTKDGTLTEVALSRDPFMPSMSVGGTYRLTDEGRLEIEQPFSGPITYGYEMMGDSLRLVGLSGGSSMYYRDTGDKPPVTYQLRTMDDRAVPFIEVRPSPVFSTGEDTTTYEGGTLTLDPLTHTYSRELTAPVSGGRYRMALSKSSRSSGTYTLDGETLTLRDENNLSQPPLTGTLRGDRLTHVSHEYDGSTEQYTPGSVMGYVKQ